MRWIVREREMGIMRKIGSMFSIVVVLLIFVWGLIHIEDILYAFENNQTVNAEEWNLMLVNRENKVPNNYTVELTQLSNGEQVDSRIYPSLQQMFDDARMQGIQPVVISGYRTHDKQEVLMQEKIAAYEAEGNSRSEAKRLAGNWVAIPGTSEHQLGIAVDIRANKDGSSTNEQVYEWFSQNAHKYGFILRYPSNKIEITGINYEPWHYRYVGNEAALEIYERGVCLEEYLAD